MTMKLRFEVFQILPDGTKNTWRSSRTFEGAMKEAKFSKKDVDYARRKGIQLSPHFILDTLTGLVTTVEP